MRPTAVVLFAPIVLLAACGGAATVPTQHAPAAQTAETAPRAQPTSATDFVRSLGANVTAGNTAEVEASVDSEFASRLPSGVPLASIFRAPPSGCTPSYDEGPGYGAIAIPPPMVDDDAAETARIQAIIDELQASVEVMVSCARIADDEDDDEEAGVVPLYAIALRRGDDGSFRVLAWRDFRGERPGF